jgi:hypothetical protein
MRYQPFKDADLLGPWRSECLAAPKPIAEPSVSKAGNGFIVATIALRNTAIRAFGRDRCEAESRARALAGRRN